MSINPPPTVSLNKEAQSDDEVFCEIEDYFEEAERGEPIQVGDPPQYVLSTHARLSVIASSSSGIDPSTSGMSPVDTSP